MANIKDIHLPAETKLTVTCDAVTTATVWQIGTDGKTTGSVTSVAASASGDVGPFSDDRNYRITSSGGDATITQTDQKFDTPLTALTDATITASDVISFEDASDSNNLKRDTVQGILDLAGGGAWSLINSTTASSASTVAWTDLSSDYYAYKIIYAGVTSDTNTGGISLRASTDNGSTYLQTSIYTNIAMGLTADGVPTQRNEVTTSGAYTIGAGGLGGDADQSASGEITIYNPSDSAEFKAIRWETVEVNNSDDLRFNTMGGFISTTSAINAVQLLLSGGKNGIFKLYGLSAS